jgi:hypothetical protein
MGFKGIVLLKRTMTHAGIELNIQTQMLNPLGYYTIKYSITNLLNCGKKCPLPELCNVMHDGHIWFSFNFGSPLPK